MNECSTARHSRNETQPRRAALTPGSTIHVFGAKPGCAGQANWAAKEKENRKMQVAVSYDKNGQITLMFDPAKFTSDQVTIGYQPAKGENHHVLDLPKAFESKSIHEIANTLQVNVKGSAPKLEVRA